MKRTWIVPVILVLFLSTVSPIAEAGMKKGSVGSGGTKRYTYIPNADGGSQISMIFDNASSDIDIIVGTVVEGETLITCLGISQLRQFERCEFGADDDLLYTILINSYRGSSSFRFYVGTLSDETVSNAGAFPKRSELREESGLDQTARELLQKAHKLRQWKKK